MAPSCMECTSYMTPPTTQVTPGERKLKTFKKNIRYIAMRYDTVWYEFVFVTRHKGKYWMNDAWEDLKVGGI